MAMETKPTAQTLVLYANDPFQTSNDEIKRYIEHNEMDTERGDRHIGQQDAADQLRQRHLVDRIFTLGISMK